MELRQLAAFVAVADERHFGRAAERLGTVQPAVSQLVRRLERELEIVLFDRSSHHVTLTGAGAELLPGARQVLAARDLVAETAAALVRGEQGVLRVGTSEGIGPNLNLLMARFAERRPRAGVRLQALHTPAKLRALRSGELDVAFVRAPAAVSGLRMVQLWTEVLVVVMPEQHPASGETAVALGRLSALPLILGPSSSNPGMRQRLLALCRDRGLEPQLGPPLQDLQEAFGIISAGAAWTLLTEANATPPPVGTVVRAIEGPPATTAIHLAWRASGLSQLARTFVDMATDPITRKPVTHSPH
ncbi:MAG TPA: LysR family transcriptional regulator [Pseudonocardia sp.]